MTLSCFPLFCRSNLIVSTLEFPNTKPVMHIYQPAYCLLPYLVWIDSIGMRLLLSCCPFDCICVKQARQLRHALSTLTIPMVESSRASEDSLFHKFVVMLAFYCV